MNNKQQKAHREKKQLRDKPVSGMRRKLANGYISVGCILIISGLIQKGYTIYRTKELITDYKKQIKTQVAKSINPTNQEMINLDKGKRHSDQATHKNQDILNDVHQEEKILPPIKWEEHYEEGALLGVLSIPCLDVQVALCEGTDLETLKYAVGHFKNTAFPGEKGNCAIAGHRSYTHGEYFNRLDELEVGDLVQIEVQDRIYEYKITESFIVEPEALEVLNSSQDAELTLVTCTPIYTATHRLIVKGKLMEEN